MTALAAIVLSTIFLILLCRNDPKRRRTAQLPAAGPGTLMRRMRVALACVPGLLLALSGDTAAFLIWLGGSAVIGWFVALWFGRKPAERA
jgi:hypothetical protein